MARTPAMPYLPRCDIEDQMTFEEIEAEFGWKKRVRDRMHNLYQLKYRRPTGAVVMSRSRVALVDSGRVPKRMK